MKGVTNDHVDATRCLLENKADIEVVNKVRHILCRNNTS